jgi:hypothetical protein
MRQSQGQPLINFRASATLIGALQERARIERMSVSELLRTIVHKNVLN